MVPVADLGQVVSSNQQIEACVRLVVAGEVAHRVDRVGGSWPNDVHWACLKTVLVGDGVHDHGVPVIRWADGGGITVGRFTHWYQEHRVQAEKVDRGLCRQQVLRVDRIERAAEDTDAVRHAPW